MKYFEQVKIKDKRVQGFHYSRNMGEGGINPMKSPPPHVGYGKIFPRHGFLPPWIFIPSPIKFSFLP